MEINARISHSKKAKFSALPGNPLANGLTMIVGALALGAAVVLGFLAFFILAGLLLIAGSVIGLRIWWFSRKLKGTLTGHEDEMSARADPDNVIEGEFTIMEKDSRD